MAVSIKDIQNKKKNQKKIIMLTAYDYPMAYAIDQSGIDIILVGDSLANVVLGLESTRQIGMPEILHHAKAVRRAVKESLLVVDMPFGSFQQGIDMAVTNAGCLKDETGCDAVKLEWCDQCPKITQSMVQSGIEVMGHIGLTPQAVTEKKGMRVQGKNSKSAQTIINQAKILEQSGCFAVVLECVPLELARMITEKISIPTIGIGAGSFCDGQVLVSHDLLGFFERYQPKFVKRYAELNSVIKESVRQFRSDVESGHYPDSKHSFRMPEEELRNVDLNSQQ